MSNDQPLSDRRFLVQFTDRPGGDWRLDGDFVTVESARARMDHLMDGEGKTSARVLHELYYRARPISS
jgi:hypothetical protein